MAAYQMPGPGLWAVKLVQGAVAAGAGRVSFTLKRHSLEFRCFGDFQASAAALIAAVFEQDPRPERAREHWIAALRAALGRAPRCLTLTTCQEDRIEQVEVRPEGLDTSLRRREGAFVYHRLAVLLEYGADADQPTAEELKELRERCRLCPIPITVDGRDIVRDHLPYLTSQVMPPAPDKPELELFVKPQSGTEGHHRHGGRKLKAGRYRAALFVGVARSQELRRPQAFWMRDGVLIDSCHIEGVQLPIRIDVVLPGDRCELDLSQWGVRNRASHFPCALVRQALEQMAEVGGHPEKPPATPQVAEKIFWGGLVMVGLLAGGPLVASLTLVSGMAGWTLSGRSQDPTPDLGAALRKAAAAPSLWVAER